MLRYYVSISKSRRTVSATIGISYIIRRIESRVPPIVRVLEIRLYFLIRPRNEPRAGTVMDFRSAQKCNPVDNIENKMEMLRASVIWKRQCSAEGAEDNSSVGTVCDFVVESCRLFMRYSRLSR